MIRVFEGCSSFIIWTFYCGSLSDFHKRNWELKKNEEE